MPIGHDGWIARNAHGLLGEGINDWQLDWVFKNDRGTPIGYPNSNIYTCGNYNIRSSHRSWSSYINNSQPSCWTTFPEYTTITLKSLVTTVRNPWAQQTAIGIQKKFALHENLNLQFKAESFNLTNTPIFGGPGTGSPQTAPTRTSVADASQPGAWSGYGTIGSTQQNFPRRLQLSLKVLF